MEETFCAMAKMEIVENALENGLQIQIKNSAFAKCVTMFNVQSALMT